MSKPGPSRDTGSRPKIPPLPPKRATPPPRPAPSAGPPQNEVPSGFCLGEFIVQARIDGSGPSSLFRVRHKSTATNALAVVHAKPAGFSKESAQIVRTAYSRLCQFSHPNMARVLDIGMIGQQNIYVVRQLVPGTPLIDHVRSQDWGRSLRALSFLVDRLRPMAAALDAAHRAGIFHGAIHSDSIVLGSNDVPCLTGLSPLAALQDAYVTHVMAQPENWPYLAHEQWSIHAFSAQTDQFALARLICMALGAYSQDRFATRESSRDLASQPAERPVLWLDQGANSVLSCALDPSSQRRFPTCTEFIEELARVPSCAAASTCQVVPVATPIKLENGETYSMVVELYSENPICEEGGAPSATGVATPPPPPGAASSTQEQSATPPIQASATSTQQATGMAKPAATGRLNPRDLLRHRLAIPILVIAFLVIAPMAKRYFPSPQASSASMSPAMVHNDQGMDYFNMGQYDQAIAQYSVAINIDPTLALPYANRGIAYLHKGDTDRAFEDLNEAIRVDRSCAVAYMGRSEAYGALKEWSKAIADCNKAIRLAPDDAGAYINRGLAHTEEGDLDDAVSDLTTAIRLSPDSALAYNNRGYAYFLQGEVDQAIEDYTIAIGLSPDLAMALANRAEAYRKKGMTDEANADLERARYLQ